MAKLRAAIIGSGLIAGKKHIPAFLKQKSGVELVALCDINLQAAQAVASRFGIPRTYGDLSEMLSKERPEIVDICTPPQTHAKLAVEAMRNGCHVFIEKPMALTVTDCDEIVDASKQYGAKVCVAHSDLFYYPFMRAREMVGRGDIGEFRGMRIFLSTPTDYMTSKPDHWAHRLPGGVIGETGPHIVYLTLAFIHPVRDVEVLALKLLDYPWSRFEDYRIELLGERAISSVALSYATNQWAARVDILGSEGMLLLDLQSQSMVKYGRREHRPTPIGVSSAKESAQMLAGTAATALRFASGRFKSTHEILIARFVESIRDGAQSPVTAEEGRETVRVLNRIVNRLDEKYG